LKVSLDTGKYCFGIGDTIQALELGAVKTLIVYEELEVNRYLMRKSGGFAKIAKIAGEESQDIALYKTRQDWEKNRERYLNGGIKHACVNGKICKKHACSAASGNTHDASVSSSSSSSSSSSALTLPTPQAQRDCTLDCTLALSSPDAVVSRLSTSPLQLICDDPFRDWIAENYQGEFGFLDLQFVSNRSLEGHQFVRGFGGIGAVLRYAVEFEHASDRDGDMDGGGNGFDNGFEAIRGGEHSEEEEEWCK